MNKSEVFLSYSWGGESEEIVNQLDNAFHENGILPVRDKRDLGFKGDIMSFMERIGKGKAVVIVMSDEYLKSRYCLFELLEIYRNPNFTSRIFPIVLADAHIYDPLERLQYRVFWEEKKNELDSKIKQQGLDAITWVWEEYKIYKRVFENLGEVVRILQNINALTTGMHLNDNFQTVINAVKSLIDEDDKNDDTGVAPVDLEFIVDTLREQKCILFLGPELFRTSDNGKSRQQHFFENLVSKSSGRILSFNQNGFFVFSNDHAKKRILMQIVDFYENLAEDDKTVSDLITKISEIPFHTIVSVNPDVMLETFFVEQRHPCSPEFFDKKEIKELKESPTISKPLIYNLCGSVKHQDTLILTHDDLFEYFKALMGNNSLPRELRYQLESAKDYIFLGCQFDKWYMQLILSLLNLQDERYEFIRYACKNTISEETESLCTNHFKIEFIGPDNNAFINKLHQECANAGILRNFSTSSKTDEIINNQEIKESYNLIYELEKKIKTEKDPNMILKFEETIENLKTDLLKQEKMSI